MLCNRHGAATRGLVLNVLLPAYHQRTSGAFDAVRLAVAELQTCVAKFSSARLSIRAEPSADVPVQIYVAESPHAVKLGVTADRTTRKTRSAGNSGDLASRWHKSSANSWQNSAMDQRWNGVATGQSSFGQPNSVLGDAVSSPFCEVEQRR